MSSAMEAAAHLLRAKAAFVRSMLSSGKVPNPAQLASFLRELVNAMGPMVKAEPTVGGIVR